MNFQAGLNCLLFRSAKRLFWIFENYIPGYNLLLDLMSLSFSNSFIILLIYILACKWQSSGVLLVREYLYFPLYLIDSLVGLRLLGLNFFVLKIWRHFCFIFIHFYLESRVTDAGLKSVHFIFGGSNQENTYKHIHISKFHDEMFKCNCIFFLYSVYIFNLKTCVFFSFVKMFLM